MTQGNTIDLSPHRRRANLLDVSDQRLEGLISACAIGAESAFEQLYRLTSSQLFGVLKRILKTDALAEEALQDTYVKIWNHADRYEGEKSAPRTWLVSIARNHAIDLLRKRRSREDVELNMIVPAWMPCQTMNNPWTNSTSHHNYWTCAWSSYQNLPENALFVPTAKASRKRS